MSELIKKPYQISLWGERQIYSVRNGNSVEEVFDKPKEFLNSYTKEYPIAVIGSNTMESPIKAFNPKLVRQTNGTNTLTFDIFYRYYDDEENEFKLNPFISLLSNERKIKLKYDEKWYDLIIKGVQEDSQKGTYTYTCQDLYITELSKNGYSLVFDTELENNMGSVTELGAEILKGTEWSIDIENSDTLIQKNNEALLTYEVEEQINNPKIVAIKDGKVIEEESNIIIEKKDIILISSSSYKNWKPGKGILFYWVSKGEYKKDDDSIVTNSPIYSFKPPSSFSNTALRSTSSYRGEFPVSSRKVKYIPEIQKYCYEYTKGGETYYAFIGSEFLSAVDVQNLLTNSSNFTSEFGWSGKNGTTVVLNDNGTLDLNFGTGGEVENNGLSDSLSLFQDYGGLSKGDSFILLTKTKTGNITGGSLISESTKLSTCTKFETSLVDGYSTFRIKYAGEESYSYQDLVEKSSSSPITFCLQGTGTTQLEDAKFFKEVNITYQEKDANDNIIEKTEIFIPELESIVETAMKDVYYFFNANELKDKIITSVDDLAFEGKYFEEDIPSDFIEVIKENPYEKITSITASKSNRFNLIQTLCEKFECWARFVIGHNENGSVKHLYTITEDTLAIKGKKYYTKINESGSNNDPLNFEQTSSFSAEVYEHSLDKKIVFKEYIGKENYAGFRYGINLKGITRNIDSKQIVTKLIVESNSNEYAPDGFCSIQRATMNPSRDTAIYNFNYYINNGLINEDELIADLYDDINAIGLYTRLYKMNVEAEPLIEKQVELKLAYDKALAYYTYHSFSLEEAENNSAKYGEELIEIVGSIPTSTNTTAYNDTVNDLIRKRNYAETTITKEKANIAYIEPILKRYKTELADLETTLNNYTETKESLNAEFFKKYSRFVQEGTWISEDYFDADLYYFDACKVSETSAFPQISYNINVLELSGMQEYQNYSFDVGDKTYIEDVEFFGYVKETKRPYQEEVIISEIQSFLDNPENNTIKVQNYKTRFEDLFQRVAAATQALQYHEGKYNRASDAIKEDNTIDGSVLERTLNYNFVLSDAISKEIAQGGQVIDLNSVSQPNRYVRLSGLGIQLSKDGGLNWQTAITADGINADVGVFGSLHTNNLTIYNGDDKSFYWDKNGITAYNTLEGTGTVYNQFVRFTKYGIYGYKGSSDEHYMPVSIEDIQNNSVFSLTWNGLALNSLNGGNYVRLSTEGVESSSEHGKKIIWAGSGEEDRFILYEDGSIYAKGEIYATSGHFTGKITATEGEIGGWKISSKGLHNTSESMGFFSSGDTVFKATNNFYVTSAGKLYATGADISGHIKATSGEFAGELNGATGTFSGALTGDPIITKSYFKVMDGETYVGSLGLGTGADAEGKTTNGVIMKGPSANVYAIVTDAGVRLQAGGNRITVTEGSINISTKDGMGKAYYNDIEIGSGSGTAVFG